MLSAGRLPAVSSVGLVRGCPCEAVLIFFFKQKTAYEMRISDWSSDVCSSDLVVAVRQHDVQASAQEAARGVAQEGLQLRHREGGLLAVVTRRQRGAREQIGRASCRERVGQYV